MISEEAKVVTSHLEHVTGRILIVDDDPYAIAMIKYLLEEALPLVEITTRTEPDVSGEFDVYILDNDFQGKQMARHMTQLIRVTFPESLIVTWSAELGTEELRLLMRLGCHVACDKIHLSEMNATIERIAEHLQVRQRDDRKEKVKGTVISEMQQMIRGMNELLRLWQRQF